MELAYARNDVCRLECEFEPCLICGKADMGSPYHRRCFILNCNQRRVKEQIRKLHEKLFEINLEINLRRS